MDNDDKQIGRILNRREVLTLLGAAGVGMLAGRSAAADAPIGAPSGAPYGRSIPPLEPSVRMPACVVRPAQTEGPYFVDAKLDRSDIRADATRGAAREGVMLDLSVRVSRVSAGGCAPLAGAIVDLWQCDALGVYSDVRDTNGMFDTRGQQFLRGYQRTDSAGLARFTTIYPGWYEGRTAHIHFKVRSRDANAREREFTSQLYFADEVSDAVFASAPYAANRQRRVRNDRDGIFRRGGQELLLAVERTPKGYTGTFEIGLDLD